MPITLNGTTGIAGVDGSASTPAVQGSDTNTGVFYPAADTVAIGTGGSERLRIDGQGDVMAGTTDSIVGFSSNTTGISARGETGRLFVSGADFSSFNRTSAGTIITFRTAATGVGSIAVTASATSYNTSSDYRLKENVRPMTTGLATIGALNPVIYDWISDKSKGEGFIAHELQSVIPLAVTGDKDAVDDDGNAIHQGVDYSKIVVHLVAAVQELSAKVDAQAAEIAALKASAPA